MADPINTSKPLHPQYQHFIPRFVLRKFACKPPPPTATTAAKTASTTKQKRKRKNKGQKNRGKNDFVKYYDIENQIIETRPIAEVYGHINLYRLDCDDGRDPNYTEMALSKLEGRASLICRRIEDAQQAGRSTFSLTRAEKDDVLRKFLYIMLYRSGIFRDKYYMNIEDYQGGDKPQLVAFMEKKGFKTLKQVWAHHLRIILDTRIDVEGTWKNIVREEMVPDNATHYIERITNCFLSVVQPESDDDEFILTENGFAIFEGNASWNTPTGYQFYVYHCLAPIAPRLMLVLRDNMLRTELKPKMKRMRRVGAKTGAVPRFPSLLEDLPVSPPKTSCCENQTFTENDKFLFEITKISTRHIHKMHGIMLSEARKSVTFLSSKSAAASVESWLEDRGTLPSRENPEYDMLIKLRQRKRGLLALLRPDIRESPSGAGGLLDEVREQQKRGQLALLQPDIHQHLPLGDHLARVKESQVIVRQIKLGEISCF
ncbi:hypothetical protein K440DRAFT_635016 [Wilcoxina mikolae CBS 423.85]|nr:hypothetical protein K440DRAFT_635016 [Wilcoxina mikolae CBS 423.85]